MKNHSAFCIIIQEHLALPFHLTAIPLVWTSFTGTSHKKLTNQYAQANISQKPNACAWNDVTVVEMKAFIGMTILLGIIQLPRMANHQSWYRSPSC